MSSDDAREEVIKGAISRWAVDGYPHISQAAFILAALKDAGYTVERLEEPDRVRVFDGAGWRLAPAMEKLYRPLPGQKVEDR